MLFYSSFLMIAGKKWLKSIGICHFVPESLDDLHLEVLQQKLDTFLLASSSIMRFLAQVHQLAVATWLAAPWLCAWHACRSLRPAASSTGCTLAQTSAILHVATLTWATWDGVMMAGITIAVSVRLRHRRAKISVLSSRRAIMFAATGRKSHVATSAVIRGQFIPLQFPLRALGRQKKGTLLCGRLMKPWLFDTSCVTDQFLKCLNW